MPITSNWKLTHGVTVLVAYGDLLADELPFDQGNGTEVVPSPDSAYPLLLATGNSAVSFNVAVFTDYADDKQAAAAMLNGLITTGASVVQPLYLERFGYADRYWVFASARIARATPKLQTDGDSARVRRDYSLTCAGLSYVGP